MSIQSEMLEKLMQMKSECPFKEGDDGCQNRSSCDGCEVQKALDLLFNILNKGGEEK